VNPELTIIIPVYNEEDYIPFLLRHIVAKATTPNLLEVLVIDGGSTDTTVESAKKAGANVITSKKGRASQMNLGAKYAKADILYFLHADTLPPQNFDALIKKGIKNGSQAGCFRMKFDSKNPFLQFFAWFTRINHLICRGGDQSLFITKDLFETTGGFREDYRIYEDSEFIGRLYQAVPFTVLPHYVVTSARKYNEMGWLRVQFHFGVIHLKNYLGHGPHELYRYYKKFFLKKK